MDFSYFDIAVSIIILLLGLKGIVNGFFKEFFGLVGIIGGIFVASRVSISVGEPLSELIFKLESSSAINFLGFIVVLIAFWSLMILLGTIFKKLTSLSGLGLFDRILGFIFGAGKFFLITSVIVYAVFNIKAMESNFKNLAKNSISIPIFKEIGGVIMQLQPIDNLKDETSQVSQNAKTILEDAKELVESNINIEGTQNEQQD
ncbi:MAG: CvpA family protein [Sulfurimonas sp.]|jgi:membrane protein required for colicin V production|nr:CvpA family protein [Sulfurimonadaceae bacterium]